MKWMKTHNKNGKVWFSRLAVFLFWCIVWLAASHVFDNELIFPSPITVIKRFITLLGTPELWTATMYTARKILSGFFVALIVGSLLAVLSGAFRIVKTLLMPFMTAMKSVPVASFVILAIMCFGSDKLSVFIAFVMVLPVTYISVLSGVGACDEKMLEMAKVFRMSPFKKAAFLYLPAVFPYFRSGCVMSLGLCWKAGVAAELIGVPRYSIGEQLYFSKIYFQMADLFAWTVVIVVLSAGFEKLFLHVLDMVYAKYERM